MDFLFDSNELTKKEISSLLEHYEEDLYNIMNDYIGSYNSKETREEICIRFSNIMSFDVKDITTEEECCADKIRVILKP